MTDIKIIQGNKLFDLVFTLQDDTGTVQDVAGASIKFKAQKVGTKELKVNGDMAIVDAAAGQCKYQVQAADFDDPGKYYGEIEVTFSDGQITSFPTPTIIVEAKLPK